MTFQLYAQKWLDVKRLDVGKSQYVVYKCAVKHLQPIYNIEMVNLRVQDIQAVITALAARNAYTKKPTSKRTLQSVKMTARQIIQYAIDCREIDYNAADAVRIPRSAPKSKRRSLTDAEIYKITNTPDELKTCAMLMLYGGLRRGECIPLEWSDIDLENGCISVSKAVDLTDGKPLVKAPKTEAGQRIVQIPKILTDYLKSITYKEGLVISREMYTAATWRSAWNRYTSKLNLTGVTAHMLRHTACTMMIEAGIDASTVQLQMGHNNIQTTLAIYTHVTQQHQSREVDKLDAYLTEKNADETFSLFSAHSMV